MKRTRMMVSIPTIACQRQILKPKHPTCLLMMMRSCLDNAHLEKQGDELRGDIGPILSDRDASSYTSSGDSSEDEGYLSEILDSDKEHDKTTTLTSLSDPITWARMNASGV